ncbi:MAG: hypothetical protein LC624_09360 [Halobacteriales archaeon]|nr:hypothetical protein [Halobacteriales archaeon]
MTQPGGTSDTSAPGQPLANVANNTVGVDNNTTASGNNINNNTVGSGNTVTTNATTTAPATAPSP